MDSDGRDVDTVNEDASAGRVHLEKTLDATVAAGVGRRTKRRTLIASVDLPLPVQSLSNIEACGGTTTLTRPTEKSNSLLGTQFKGNAVKHRRQLGSVANHEVFDLDERIVRVCGWPVRRWAAVLDDCRGLLREVKVLDQSLNGAGIER
jgi:hypothetical protein